ncbi:hypothetical protein SH1V18_03520 [Vallitalea longa]|uniref:rRNA biogenesis protein rrp5 n=1 Tax=Vallitalea longa TaxID=2936439 RepID=A0A9W6DE06_9FIRM|nr:hypothetical protein [Vallitalea longa]GKX27872.1 hypothetical protein SH1V18_03520 [Vallitalea longa]
MLEVKVTITLAKEVLNLLSNLAGGIKAFKPEQGQAMQQVSAESIKPSVEPKQNVEVEQPKKEEPKELDTTKPDEQVEPSVTIEEIRSLTAKAAKKDKPAVKKLLTKFEAKSVSTLATDNYQAFYDEVKELV